MEIADRVVVVTGGARGIGRALARKFSAAGAEMVIVADVDADGAWSVAREIGGMAIDVDVHEGVVTLKGKVRTDKMRSKAEKVAKKVKGVTSVNNQLAVSPD